MLAAAVNEFADLKAEATSIHAVMADAHTELVSIQKPEKSLTEEAAKGTKKEAMRRRKGRDSAPRTSCSGTPTPSPASSPMPRRSTPPPPGH
ncbi:hypothetical protein ACIGEZ_03415 [Streptomyces sp. NPDC085481]|uniref:hypothetical protein n=1 Tax=Streptomyces sp. NPDC085481 TaxID=3365727 RepID=UPI0037D75ED7